MDLLSRILQLYYEWIYSLSDQTTNFLLRAALLLALSLIATGWLFVRGNRLILPQVTAFVFSVLAVALLPLESLHFGSPSVKTWVLTLAIILIGFLPSRLPFFLTPDSIWQRRISRGIYLGLLFLFILNLI